MAGNSGTVGLMIDANPNQTLGFVRSHPGAPRGVGNPIIGSDVYEELGWGWSYRGND